MRSKKDNEIRTAREDIMVGTKVRDRNTGAPAVRVKGKGDKYDVITLQEVVEAFYGKGARIIIKTA